MNRSLFLQNNISQFIIRYSEEDLRFKEKSASVTSEYALPKHNKKNSIFSRDNQLSLDKNKRKFKAARSIPTNPDDKKEEREYSRVPIEYLDERDNGNPADRARGRVVYRGYAPKNTYYYFKTIKQLKFNPNIKAERDYRGEDITFNSKFESGNLNAAVRISNRQYWLYMREDTNSHGLRQWFYFEARSRKKGFFKFRIYKFTKRFSLYKMGMKPYIRTVDSEWRQEGEKIIYEYDSEQKCFYLEFEFNFEEHKEVYFAALPPYTYSTLHEYIQSIAEDQKVAVRKIGLSLGGLDLISITISDKHRKKENQHECLKNQTKQNFHNSLKKQAIIVFARTHPGETVSNWALESFIGHILSTPLLTDHYNFYILPMINPDGVFLGNHRTGVLGQDLNRNFHGCDLDYFPEVQVAESLVASVQKKMKIAFMFDLHGHSAKKNIFAYGEECQLGSPRYLFGRIIPYILSNTIDSFKYDHCVFKASKEKKTTARVFFSKKYGFNAITFEQSYGLLDVGCIGINNWRNFGKALADSLAVYLSVKRESPEKQIGLYLSSLVQSQQKEIDRKKEIQLQKLRQQEREREELRLKLSTTNKTQGYEQSTPKFIAELLLKTPKSLLNHEILKERKDSQRQIVEEDEESELSSGDEDLQLQTTELEGLKKDIFKVGTVNKDIVRRQLLSMAEKKVQLSPQYIDYTNRLHYKQSSAVQRIFKFKSRQKVRETDFIRQSFSYREKGSSIELPAIKR